MSRYCQHPDCEHARLTPVEGNTKYCATRNSAIRNDERKRVKAKEKLKGLKVYGTRQQTPISKDPKKWKNTFNCSDGEKVTEHEIRSMLKLCSDVMDERRKEAGISLSLCDATNMRMMVIDKDHTIPKACCKELGKTELIWDENNIEYSSRTAHQEWESYKSGKFIKHINFDKRMAFVKLHDPETYEKRMQVWAEHNKPTDTI